MTDRDDKPVRVPIQGGDDSPGDEEETSEQLADTSQEQEPQAERSDSEQPSGDEEAEGAPTEKEQEDARDWKAMYEEEHEERLRAVADLKNYRRRSSERQAQQRRFANETLLADLLNVLDNFDQALGSLNADDCSTETVLQGVEMIHRQLEELTERHGVTKIEAEGARFDPNYHEAVERVETDDVPDMTILEVTSPGYMLHDRVLRPARVRVAVSPSDEEHEQEPEGDSESEDKQ